MDKQQHDEAVNSLKEICREIGCSGLNPDMCNNRPHHCDIIRKLVNPVKSDKLPFTDPTPATSEDDAAAYHGQERAV